jgi:hypothetical protein
VDKSEQHFPGKSKELCGKWEGISEHIGNKMTYKIIIDDDTGEEVCRSAIQSALDPLPLLVVDVKPVFISTLKLCRILRKNYLKNSFLTQKPSRPPTTNLDSEQYTYYYKQARHNRITWFDCLLIPLLPQIHPKQHIRHHFRKNPSVVLETSFEDPQQKSLQAGSRALKTYPTPIS